MSIYDSSNDGLSLNHPRVVSYMSASEQTAEAAEGGLRTFAAIVSSKGEDNKLKLISNTTELVNEYGELNNKLYGQTMYNLQNWLGGNGEAYVLRVMPEDAGYAHAFVNVQTKRGNKVVKDINGDKIETFSNINIRTVSSTTEVNNINESLLKYELNKDRSGSKTIDGYENHLLMAVYPKGRGKAYNSMGFRLTLNTQMDNAYDFRVYNFEVVDFGKDDIVEIKEGPFLVSLDPNALSSSNDQSMFIEDVVASYSKYFKVYVNTEMVEKVCRMINPNVEYLYSIDPIFGRTRVVRGEKEVYLDPITKKEEDIHITLHAYDVEGNPILDADGEHILNIVDPSSELEKDILINENSFNKKKFEEISKNEEDMLKVLAIAKNPTTDGLKNIVTPIYDSEGSTGKINVAKTALDTSKEQARTAKTTLEDQYSQDILTEGSFSTIDSHISNMFNKETEILNNSKTIVNYSKSVREAVDTDIPDVSASIRESEQSLEQVNNIRLRHLKERQNIADLIVELAVLNSERFDIQKESVPVMLTIIRDNINFINQVQAIVNTGDTNILTQVGIAKIGQSYVGMNVETEDLKIKSLNKAYEDALVEYNEVLDEFNSSQMKVEYMNSLLGHLADILGKCRIISRMVVTRLEYGVATSLVERISSIISKLNTISNNAINQFNTGVSNGAALRILIKNNIKLNRSESESAKSLLCAARLQDYTLPVRLTEGSDGCIDEENEDRNNNIKKLLIKAYSGLIDNTILDPRLTPFSFVLDGNNSIEVKNAIVQLCNDIRKDFIFIADCGLQPDAERTLEFRKDSFPVSSNLVAIYGQDFTVYDSFNGKDERFTTPYFLAKKITNQASSVGLQYPMAGNSRGTIDGFKSMNFVPNTTYRELLYNNRINYVVSDEKRTKLMSQLTSNYSRSALSNLNNVITTLSIKREVENLVQDYQFEFEDDDTLRKMEYAISDSLNRYVTNKSCSSVKATVSASDYDRSRNQVKVQIALTFRGVIETVIITINGEL